jgi:hypothetical protein
MFGTNCIVALLFFAEHSGLYSINDQTEHVKQHLPVYSQASQSTRVAFLDSLSICSFLHTPYTTDVNSVHVTLLS